MKRPLFLACVIVVALAGCERVFTTSPFPDTWQRNPSSYSETQLLNYADDALASGDEAAMRAAFDLLSSSTNPETQLVAVELALGAAGVGTVLTDLIANLAAEGADPETAVSEALSAFTADDLALLVAAGTLLDSADEGVDPSAEQYAFVAIGLIAAASDDAGGIDQLNPPPADSDAEDYVDQATVFLDEAATLLTEEGGSTDILDGFADLIP